QALRVSVHKSLKYLKNSFIKKAAKLFFLSLDDLKNLEEQIMLLKKKLANIVGSESIENEVAIEVENAAAMEEAKRLFVATLNEGDEVEFLEINSIEELEVDDLATVDFNESDEVEFIEIDATEEQEA